MAITYDAPNNTITVTGYTEGTPCKFVDIWNADLAGESDLREGDLAQACPTLIIPLFVEQLQPADSKALKVKFEITSFVTAGTIRITGADLEGNSQTEDISITGNGVYESTLFYSSFFSDAPFEMCGEYHFRAYQDRWGIVWKQGTNQFQFDARLIIGDDSTATWFAATLREVVFTTSAFSSNSQSAIQVKTNANFRYGVLIDEATKRTRNGVAMFTYAGANNYINAVNGTGNIEVYSSIFDCDSIASKERRIVGANVKIYNCVLNGHILQSIGASGEIYNIVSYGARRAVWSCTCPIDKLFVFNTWPYAGGAAVGQYYTYAFSARNVVGRNNPKFFYASSIAAPDKQVINFDFDTWGIIWAGSDFGGKILRQYEFNRKILDKNGDVYVNRTWTLKDKDGNTVVSGTTQGDGMLSATDLVITHGYFKHANGQTETEYGPFKLTVSGSGENGDLILRNLPIDTKDVTGVETMPPLQFIGQGGGPPHKLVPPAIIITANGHVLININRKKHEYVLLPQIRYVKTVA